MHADLPPQLRPPKVRFNRAVGGLFGNTSPYSPRARGPPIFGGASYTPTSHWRPI